MTKALPLLAAIAIAGCSDAPADPDSGPPPEDTGTTPMDAPATPEDTGTPPMDAPVTPEDTGTPPTDAPPPMPDAPMTPDSGPPTPACGTTRPTITGVTGTEGLVIARDGTIYYSQMGRVGRLLATGTQNNAWATLTGATTVWGLALDASNTTLYAGSPGNNTIYRVDVATATATAWLTGAGGPNGLTMGPDGALYYSDFGGGHVYRVPAGTPTGVRTRVTTSTIAQPNGVMFFPDGTLLVASYGTGVLHRLTLTAGLETARATFATGTGSADGLALDSAGRVYVGSQSGGGRLLQVAADGSSVTPILTGVGGIANIEFGAGPLDCEDIYITSSGMMRRYEMGTTAGASVPWH
jgi:sugar lactone lactonase YvrE